MDTPSYLRDEGKVAVAKFIKEKCIYKPEQTYMHGKAPGTRYQSQYYMAELLYNPKMLEYVGENFFDEVHHIYGHEYQIAAGAWSGIPLLSFLPYYIHQKHGYHINAFYVRDCRKSYGRNNLIEGTPLKRLPTIVVGDICNSTDAFWHARTACYYEQIPVAEHIYAILDKYSKQDQCGLDRVALDAKTISMLDRDDLYDIG